LTNDVDDAIEPLAEPELNGAVEQASDNLTSESDSDEQVEDADETALDNQFEESLDNDALTSEVDEETAETVLDNDFEDEFAPAIAETAENETAAETVKSEDEANFEAVFQSQLAEAINNEQVEETPVVNETVGDLSEFENVDISNLKSVDESISELEKALSDNDMLAKQLGDVAFNEDVPLPTVDKEADAFIDIDTLLENNETQDVNEEFNLNIGLDEFPDVVESFSEFDIDEGGIAAKLDLARAYLEIDEINGATEILTSLLDTAKDEQLKEVQKLFNKIK